MNVHELPIPPIAVQDDRAFELLRVWVARGAQHVTLNANVWRDPGAWGIMLVDLAKHIASAYATTGENQRNEVLARIRHAMDAEWKVATDTPTGGPLND